MQLLVPDILEEASKLSTPILAAALVAGFLLWALGWFAHRFWIAFIATLGGGIAGLYWGPGFELQPWLAAVLMGLTAGLLALALARLVAFAAGGALGLAVLRYLPANWQQPIIVFLASGLVGLVLFRLWIMILTSSAGTLLMAYSGLCLAQRFGTLNLATLADGQASLLNIGCAAIAFVGVFVQFYLDRRRRHDDRRRSEGWRDGAEAFFGGRYPRSSRSYNRAG